jgi:LmbE family N-acetylglucosaminyl deacetylase
VTHLVAVSPHLDDAVFSAGGTLARHVRDGGQVTVVTCFTGNVARPAGFALACQLDKGLPADADYMALRRAEDVSACAAIGATPIHLPFLEAPHRGYASAPELFANRRADDRMVEDLAPALTETLAALAPDRVLGPLCLGNHVDHWVVREALGARADLWWEDWPYLDRAGVVVGSEPAERVELDDALVNARIAMCGAYTTQLGFQFGGHDAMAARLRAIREERFHQPSPRP